MRDVQRYPLLSKEEEHDLAVRFFEDEDLDAAKRLVTSNLRLVVKIAYDYRQAYKNILDLVQEGNIGLMQAVKKYDPYCSVVARRACRGGPSTSINWNRTRTMLRLPTISTGVDWASSAKYRKNLSSKPNFFANIAMML